MADSGSEHLVTLNANGGEISLDASIWNLYSGATYSNGQFYLPNEESIIQCDFIYVGDTDINTLQQFTIIADFYTDYSADGMFYGNAFYYNADRTMYSSNGWAANGTVGVWNTISYDEGRGTEYIGQQNCQYIALLYAANPTYAPNPFYVRNIKINIGGEYIDSKTVTTGASYGTLPTPTREGYHFEGWATSKSGGEFVTADSVVTASSDHTLWAQWTPTWDHFAASSYASGSGTAASPYIIKTPEQLAKLAKDSRTSTLSGTHFKLESDIDLSGHAWMGIAAQDYTINFTGIFDGNMHTISKIMTLEEGALGLFNNNNGVIKNVILSASTFISSDIQPIGAFSGSNEGTISNCIVDGVTVIYDRETGNKSAGIFVGANEGTVENCLVRNSSLYKKSAVWSYTGGFVGNNPGKCINCCVIASQVTHLHMGGGETLSGAFTGGPKNGITSCYAEASVVTSNAPFTTERVIYGNADSFTGFFYNANLNGGYPIPKTLLSLGSVDIPSATIYNALIAKEFKTA